MRSLAAIDISFLAAFRGVSAQASRRWAWQSLAALVCFLVTVHGSQESPFAPRKQRYFRGAKGDIVREMPGIPLAARERLRFLGVLQVVAAADRDDNSPWPSRFDHFISRRGDKLMEGDREFRFVGANMPGLVLPYDYWLGIPERMVLPTPWEQADGLKSLRQMGAGCTRTWNLPIRHPDAKRERWHYVWGPGEFNEAAFKTLDSLLAQTNRYGVRVMLDLTADAGDYLGGVGTYAAHRGKPRAAFFSDPQIMDDFKAFIRHVLTRVNTVTGVPYKDDKSILAWQFGNEMDRTKPGADVQRAWQSEMAAYMKQLDPNHLIAYGQRFLPDKPDKNVDIVVQHFYGGDWPAWARRARAATKGKRPLVVSEFGMRTNAEPYRAVLDEVIANGTAGIMVWSMYFHHRGGGFWWHAIPTDRTKGLMFSYHWPGFAIGERIDERPILDTLRRSAFRIQGLPVPPREPPEPPELLPFARVPVFSWRGSAGASGYDVERATGASGPWKTIDENLSDAEVAYRPLYSDVSARPGQVWYYRVVARNEAGASAPSNVVGPVRIERIYVVDELRDLSMAETHSDGLKLVNAANSYCGEYLYRAKGDTGDVLVYRPGLDISCVKLWAWGPAGKPQYRLSVSAHGKQFKPLDVESSETTFTANRGGQKATEVRIRADVPAGMRLLKIEWAAASELDRVEIYACGKP